jgi:hypothetical protein
VNGGHNLATSHPIAAKMSPSDEYVPKAQEFVRPACGELGGKHFNREGVHPTFDLGVERIHDGAMLGNSCAGQCGRRDADAEVAFATRTRSRVSLMS